MIVKICGLFFLTFQKNKTNLPVIIRVSTETAVLFGGEMKHEQIGTCKQADNSELPLQSWWFEHEPPHGTVKWLSAQQVKDFLNW